MDEDITPDVGLRTVPPGFSRGLRFEGDEDEDDLPTISNGDARRQREDQEFQVRSSR